MPVHKVHRTAHRIVEPGVTARGVYAADMTHDLVEEGEDLSYARLCWRGGCAPREKLDDHEAIEFEGPGEEEPEDGSVSAFGE